LAFVRATLGGNDTDNLVVVVQGDGLQRAAGEMFGEQHIKRSLIRFGLNTFWGTENLSIVFGHIKSPKGVFVKLYRNLGIVLSINGADLIKALHFVDNL
jgi:hypothetical protein